jgi:hypothetical protein
LNPAVSVFGTEGDEPQRDTDPREYLMDTTPSTIRAMRPSLIQTPTGWLALSPRLAPINIGVVAATEDEARTRFCESTEAWARLREAPEPDFYKE